MMGKVHQGMNKITQAKAKNTPNSQRCTRREKQTGILITTTNLRQLVNVETLQASGSSRKGKDQGTSCASEGLHLRRAPCKAWARNRTSGAEEEYRSLNLM